MRRLYFLSIIFLIVSCTSKSVLEADIIIEGGEVYDGVDESAKPWTVAIKDDKIIYAGDGSEYNLKAEQIIDASGKVVSPGFIDPHTHSTQDLNDSVTRHNLPFLSQGVTTVIIGNDGRSPIPVGRAMKQWGQSGAGTNVGVLLGHGNVRRVAMGMENRPPSDEEMEEMREIVTQAMEDGALGMSTGLYYTPGNYASTEEVIDLAKIVSSYGGVYDTHQRDESSYSIGLLNSIREVIRIGAEAKLPVHISHLKALGVDVWDMAPEIIALYDSARAAGIDITANQYPYVASGTSVGGSTFPNWARAGGTEEMIKRIDDEVTGQLIRTEMKDNLRRRGGASSLLITRSGTPEWIGQTLEDLSKEWRIEPIEAAIKIIKAGDASVASFNMTEEDIALLMAQPWCMTGSDGSAGHPRKYGTYPRKFRKYVIEDSIISMGRMVVASSGQVAETFKIKERGQIKEGYFADIVIIDPETIRDNATFEKPEQIASGIDYVLVNGEVAIDNGRYNGVLAGEILKRD
ncbi:MAG: D-aminoacylase [Cyclobacteriaceae bacterium]